MKLWYQLGGDQVLSQLSVSKNKGLSQPEATKRLKDYGLNQLTADKKINPFKLFINQFKDVLIIVLLVAAAVSFALAFVEDGGSIKESMLIMAIVVAIALVGFFNEYKAERTVAALTKLVAYKAKVRRGGKILELNAFDLVPGDIVLLESGQKVPADIRLVEVNDLSCNEASLTGESLPVNKNINSISKEVPLGDQKCLVFAGTFINNGSAVGVVVSTGARSEIGKIADLVNSVESEDTPMQKKLDDLGKKMGYFVAIICVLVFFAVFFFVKETADVSFVHQLIFAFTAAVALAVAAIPEGLAFVVRISLALGARRMAAKNALVRKLSAVEALGSTDVICSDKTGTLTKGEMTVRALYINGVNVTVTGSGYESDGKIEVSSGKKPANLQQLLEIGVLCNDAHVNSQTVIGDPTEGSLIVSAGKLGLTQDALNKKYPRIAELPFNSERKRMSTVHKHGSKYLVATKGATEMVLARCTTYVNASGAVVKLTPGAKQTILKNNNKLAGQALRVLAFATKVTSATPKGEHNIESGLTFVGLQAMMDPPRKEVAAVMDEIQNEAGLRVIMITGDYIETAKAVAAEIGIKGKAISGPDLDKLTQKQFEDKVEQISVYARVNPEHKIRIIQALKKHGHQVAMTGDGVNDAPAIKAADIGIAMGKNGTDVAKEAADLILLDDQFLTIIAAIEEGRGIFDNVRKFVNFLISCNIAEVITIVLGVLLFGNLLLTAAQLLFINIVTDGLPAVALGSDPAQKGVLKSKPARFQEAIISTRIWVEIFVFGVLMSIALILHYWYSSVNVGHLAAVSAVFIAMIVYELVRLVDIRTDYKIKWFSNPWLTVAMLSSFALALAVLFVPAMAKYFSIQRLINSDWIFIVIGSVTLFIVMKLLNPVLDHLVGEAEHPKTLDKTTN